MTADALVPTTLLIDWLLTYAIHSTVILAAVWFIARYPGGLRPARQQALWRGAMLGAILTATLQTVVGLQPLTGAISFGAPAATLAEPLPATTHSVIVPPELPAAKALSPTADSSPPISTIIWWLLAAAWIFGAAVGLLRVVIAARRLARLLRDRRPLPSGRLITRLAHQMGIRRRVRLSASDALPVPFATGVIRAEICVPSRISDELSAAQKHALMAHEMAHVARHDPTWQLVYRLIEGLLFFQPLNRIARRRLEDNAELLADDRAVACTGDRAELARCLLDVAGWSADLGDAVPAAAALPGRGRLHHRITRILHARDGEAIAPAWLPALVICSVLATAFLIPGVSLSTADAADAAEAPAAMGRVSSAEAAPAPPRPSAEPAPESAPAAPVAAKLPSPSALPAPPASPTREQSPALPAPPAPPSDSADVVRDLEAEVKRLRGELARLRRQLAEENRDLAGARADHQARAHELDLLRAEKIRNQADRLRDQEHITAEHAEALKQRAEELAQRQRLSEERQKFALERAAVRARERERQRDEFRAQAEEAARERAEERDSRREERLHEGEERARARAEAARQEAEERKQVETARRQEAEAQAEAERLEEEARKKVEESDKEPL